MRGCILKHLREKDVLWLEATYDAYGNSTYVHYTDGEKRMLPGWSARGCIKRAMEERCMDPRRYRQKMKAWLGKEADYPYWLSPTLILVPIKTREVIKLPGGRRNHDDVYSYYNHYFCPRP